jgi:hypothetical protein
MIGSHCQDKQGSLRAALLFAVCAPYVADKVLLTNLIAKIRIIVKKFYWYLLMTWHSLMPPHNAHLTSLNFR